MNAKEDIKNQITGALAHANFPLNTPEALLMAFPNGADTVCQSGDITLRAGDAGAILIEADFSVTDAETIAEAIVSRAL